MRRDEDEERTRPRTHSAIECFKNGMQPVQTECARVVFDGAWVLGERRGYAFWERVALLLAASTPPQTRIQAKYFFLVLALVAGSAAGGRPRQRRGKRGAQQQAPPPPQNVG